MAWDYPDALAAIRSDEAGGCVAAVLCGHDHAGHYFRDEHGVHHCTFSSPLNKGDDGFPFGLVCVVPSVTLLPRRRRARSAPTPPPVLAVLLAQ